MTTPTPAQHLEPCPFCGGEAYYYAETVTCKKCGCRTAEHVAADFAIATWNRRTPNARALAALEAVEKMKRELPHRVESESFGDLNAEELSIFDNGYNAALLLCHNLMAASGLTNGGGDDVDANFGARLVAAPPADAVEVSRG